MMTSVFCNQGNLKIHMSISRPMCMYWIQNLVFNMLMRLNGWEQQQLFISIRLWMDFLTPIYNVLYLILFLYIAGQLLILARYLLINRALSLPIRSDIENLISTCPAMPLKLWTWNVNCKYVIFKIFKKRTKWLMYYPEFFWYCIGSIIWRLKATEYP